MDNKKDGIYLKNLLENQSLVSLISAFRHPHLSSQPPNCKSSRDIQSVTQQQATFVQTTVCPSYNYTVYLQGSQMGSQRYLLKSELFVVLTLLVMGGGPFQSPLSENRDFSGTEPPLDLRPVCKLKFVHCGPGEKNQSSLSFSVWSWRPNKVREHLFSSTFDKFLNFSSNSKGTS